MISELLLFGKSILYGAVMAASYDVLRIVRRIIRHKAGVIMIEDLLYWISSSVFLFVNIYQENGGILRGYIFVGVVLGMILWHYMFGVHLVKWISGTIRLWVKRLKNVMLRCKIALCKQLFRKS